MSKQLRQVSAQDIETRLEDQFDRSLSRQEIPGFLGDYFFDDSEKWESEWDTSLTENGSQKRRTGHIVQARREGRTAGLDDVIRSADPLPPITNRGVSKYQNPICYPLERRTLQDIASTLEAEQLQLGGYDGGIEVGFEGKWDTEKFAELLAKLETAKNQASEESKSSQTEIGGVPVLVDSCGVKVGRGLYYKYRFTFDGVVFMIHHNPPKHRQGVRIRYGATALIGRNLFVIHAAVLEFLASLGFIITQEKVSRVDMQVMIECKASELILPALKGHAVAKSRGDGIHRKYGQVETHTLGSGGRLQLCIYDKRKELGNALVSDPIKFALMLRHCIGEQWYSDFDRPITRIEFRLWREPLRAMGINTVQDLQEHEAALADWLTSHWFRLLKEPKIRGHENTAEIHPLWVKVQEAFCTWFPGVGDDNKPVKWTKRERVSCDPIPLIKQAAGCIASAVALQFGALPTAEQVWETIRTVFEPLKIEIFNRSVERAERLEIIKGVKLGIRETCNLDEVKAGLEQFFVRLNERKTA